MKKIQKSLFVSRIKSWEGKDVLFVSVHKNIEGIERELESIEINWFKKRILEVWLKKTNLEVIEKTNHLLLNGSRMDFGVFYYDRKFDILFVEYADGWITAYTVAN